MKFSKSTTDLINRILKVNRDFKSIMNGLERLIECDEKDKWYSQDTVKSELIEFYTDYTSHIDNSAQSEFPAEYRLYKKTY